MGTRPTDIDAILDSSGVTGTVEIYKKAETVYAQGDVCRSVMYLREGKVTLSVLSKTGRKATVSVVDVGHFFGEAALTGRRLRAGSATATAPSRVLVIPRVEMQRLLHEQHALSDRFIEHLLARNTGVQEDLLEQLFNGVEKRLARALLLLASHGEPGRPPQKVPKVSQKALAEMTGITRAHVSFFMSKFTRLGFIQNDRGLTVNSSLLGVVLGD
jgi:CRP-like cAMP-binding protein